MYVEEDAVDLHGGSREQKHRVKRHFVGFLWFPFWFLREAMVKEVFTSFTKAIP